MDFTMEPYGGTEGSSENKINYSTSHELAAFLFLSNILFISSSEGLLLEQYGAHFIE